MNAPNVPACGGLGTWATADRTNGVGPAEANLIRIVDVNGTRVVVTGASFGLGAIPTTFNSLVMVRLI